MWGADHLARARRRLPPRAARRLTAPAGPRPDRADVLVPRTIETTDLELALSASEREAFVAALGASLPSAASRLDTPAGLAAALGKAIAGVGGAGRPSVTRSPAGLYTPEYWHIRIEAADAATRAELRRLAGGRRIDG